ncbi:MAG: hypothetical protein AVDCRST_MAG54-2858, partial [uncultured Actinomycetospora sp.]
DRRRPRRDGERRADSTHPSAPRRGRRAGGHRRGRARPPGHRRPAPRRADVADRPGTPRDQRVRAGRGRLALRRRGRRARAGVRRRAGRARRRPADAAALAARRTARRLVRGPAAGRRVREDQLVDRAELRGPRPPLREPRRVPGAAARGAAARPPAPRRPGRPPLPHRRALGLVARAGVVPAHRRGHRRAHDHRRPLVAGGAAGSARTGARAGRGAGRRAARGLGAGPRAPVGGRDAGGL